MKWLDPDLCAALRAMTHHCQHCGRFIRSPEVHHIEPRGMDGSKHLDVRINLIVLGGPWDCGCHAVWHGRGDPKVRRKFREIVADREGTTANRIEELMLILVRIPTWWGWHPDDIIARGIIPEGPK